MGSAAFTEAFILYDRVDSMSADISPSFKEKYWPPTRNFIGGYFSGMALVLAGHPFDTVKVRLQTEGLSGRFKGPVDCLMQTLRQEGFRGLYKGVTPPLFMTGFVNSVMFGLMGISTRAVKKDEDGPATIPEIMEAAVYTGFAISFLVTPMEGIKARLQVQYKNAQKGVVSEGLYKGPVDCAIRVTKQFGLAKGLYRGWLPTALSRMSNWSYFGSYEYFRRLFSKDSSNKKLSMGSAVLAGGLTGFCYWFSCYPIDVVKNRIMAAPDVSPPLYKNMRHAFATIYAKEGLRGFFVGFTPCLARAFPANAAAFTMYEIVMHLLPQ